MISSLFVLISQQNNDLVYFMIMKQLLNAYRLPLILVWYPKVKLMNANL